MGRAPQCGPRGRRAPRRRLWTSRRTARGHFHSRREGRLPEHPQAADWARCARPRSRRPHCAPRGAGPGLGAGLGRVGDRSGRERRESPRPVPGAPPRVPCTGNARVGWWRARRGGAARLADGLWFLPRSPWITKGTSVEKQGTINWGRKGSQFVTLPYLERVKKFGQLVSTL